MEVEFSIVSTAYPEAVEIVRRDRWINWGNSPEQLYPTVEILRVEDIHQETPWEDVLWWEGEQRYDFARYWAVGFDGNSAELKTRGTSYKSKYFGGSGERENWEAPTIGEQIRSGGIPPIKYMVRLSFRERLGGSMTIILFGRKMPRKEKKHERSR